MGKTRGNRGGKARKRRQQEQGGAQKVAALKQVDKGEIVNKGGVEGTVLDSNQEQGEQHEAAFGSTGGGCLPQSCPV